ncbi:MAG TPA: flagellar hook-associated protein FlgL [Solirubrobacteraceae bacterium]|jgi:flagellar hook-associated protein 3 FlgL|nr:flagellar hook-associated protein FlgL [Solirubrobacteraceae bacterium]
MSERITPAMVTSATLNDLNASLGSLTRTTDELSSGKKILEPSDNPYGASQVIDLQSQLEGLSSYESNAQDGISWENTASTAMSSMGQAAQRVRELLVQGANGTYNQSDLETMALQVEQLTESVKQDANTEYAGQYLFSGTATTTAPYEQGAEDEYQGNSESVSRAVGPGATVTVTTNISTLLGNGEASKDGKLLDTLRTIAKNLRAGTVEAREALGTTDLQNLDGNLETLTQLQATAGSATDQLQTALSRNEDLQGSISQALSNTDDTNVAAVSVEYANEQAAYEAALRAAASIVQESLLNFLQ